jgi:hypothetical protein
LPSDVIEAWFVQRLHWTQRQIEECDPAWLLRMRALIIEMDRSGR